VENIGVGEMDGDVAVCVSWWVVSERDGYAIEVNVFSVWKTSDGMAPGGEALKVKFQPSTRVSVERCFLVFSCAENGCACGVQPFVAVSVVEVPVRVD